MVIVLLLLPTFLSFTPLPLLRPQTSSLTKLHSTAIMNSTVLSPILVTSLPPLSPTKYPTLSTIKRSLSPSLFEINTKKSLTYVAKDILQYIVTTAPLLAIASSDQNPILQTLESLPFFLASGTSLWSLWCLGHDAGHGLISPNPKVNEIVGELCHGCFCGTPFWGWKESHARHHMGHNHLTNDYSHQWFILPEAKKVSNEIESVWWMKLGYDLRAIQLPFLYFIYLYIGIPDGNHFIPVGRLWDDLKVNRNRALISSTITITYISTLIHFLGLSFIPVILIPWLGMSFWLFMVTYLQHHSEEGVLYTEESWGFVKGAFETVDRDYGEFWNEISHNMMDGHVLHHLFFTGVPHYNLQRGTSELKQVLRERGELDYYKFEDTKDFVGEIWRKWNDNWFFVNEDNVIYKE
ncbi:hypothetical protein TrLO_g7549 [Triparma laevis f. longispina]|uniref:Fatty acid desaturase domain-containing protein n=2 Tax=Triparma laevis f. longispina TaxID=1714387 RepID=A0A9W7DYY4_9STRA|nr:hypothetical protein TrLO_g7549 [Triparma laevis f. longispina]